MNTSKICLVGIGKIAVDQHVPALRASADWELAATVSRAGTVDGVESYTDFDAMLDEDAGVSLFATWHSRMACGVAGAKAWLAGKQIETFHITWKEDVRRWHPGQDWVFAPGGMGVFDPGINALSIMTEILPEPVFLREATLDFPENCDTPIAADLRFSGNVTADFDWRQEGPQSWDIRTL